MDKPWRWDEMIEAIGQDTVMLNENWDSFLKKYDYY